jgi:hypothetical protein
MTMATDTDLDGMSREQLVVEVKRLRQGNNRQSLDEQLPHAPRTNASHPKRSDPR